MTLYFPVKYLHVPGALFILGTGTRIAFVMLMAHSRGDAVLISRPAARGGGGAPATTAEARSWPARFVTRASR